jgi:hypothetical protein
MALQQLQMALQRLYNGSATGSATCFCVLPAWTISTLASVEWGSLWCREPKMQNAQRTGALQALSAQFVCTVSAKPRPASPLSSSFRGSIVTGRLPFQLLPPFFEKFLGILSCSVWPHPFPTWRCPPPEPAGKHGNTHDATTLAAGLLMELLQHSRVGGDYSCDPFDDASSFIAARKAII